MELESQPEPVTLGDAKELLEKELSVRENKLRCIDCGHFQPVPDIEPEPASKNSEEDEEEDEGPKGPTCDSCGSERMTLIEQIQYEHKLALDHVRVLAQSTPEISKAIIEKVSDLEHVDEYYAAKIADILPMHPDDVRSIFARERFSLGREEIDSIINAVRETTGA